jgi:hypothetical protein
MGKHTWIVIKPGNVVLYRHHLLGDACPVQYQYDAGWASSPTKLESGRDRRGEPTCYTHGIGARQEVLVVYKSLVVVVECCLRLREVYRLDGDSTG